MAHLGEDSSSSSSQQQHNVISNTVSSEAGAGAGAGAESEPPKTKKAKAVATSTLKRKAVDGKDIAIVKNNNKKRSVLKDDVAEEENNSNRKTTIPTKEEKKLKASIQRIWSDDDEILALQQLLDYKKVDPTMNMEKFYDHAKEFLHVNVSASQVAGKMRRLRDKYKSNLLKEGENIAFSTEHESRLFKISNRIWGTDDNKKKGVKSEENNDYCFRNIDAALDDIYPYNQMSKEGRELVKRSFQYIDIEDLKKLENEWEEFHVEEFTHCKRGVEVLDQLTALVDRAMKSHRSRPK